MALVDLGKYAAAAALVPTSAVPTSFQYAMTFSQATQSNEIWSLNASQSSARYVVGDSFDIVTGSQPDNALPFASAKDPRVPISGGASTTPRRGHRQGDAVGRWSWTARRRPSPSCPGVDARLIEAEAKLIRPTTLA